MNIKKIAVVIVVGAVGYFILWPRVKKQAYTYNATRSAFMECNEPFTSVERCSNGDWVVGRQRMGKVEQRYRVYNRLGYLVGEVSGEGKVDDQRLEYKFRKAVGLEFGCSEKDSVKVCKWK